MRVTGQHGELRVGYQVAARLGSWEIRPTAGSRPSFLFTATVRDEHAVWGTETVQDLVLTVGQTAWVWTGVTLARRGNEASVMLTERPKVEQLAAVSPPL